MASAQRNDNDIPGVAHTQGIGISMSPPPATVGNIMETIDSDTTNRLFPTDPSHHDDLYRTISKTGSTVPPLQSPEGPNTPPVKSVPANIRLSEPNSKTLSPLLKLTSSRDSHPRLKVQAPDEQSPSSGPVLLSPGATALHPFGRPPPQSQQGDNIDTPLSPLPSHLLNRGFLPSPSLLFPEWILSNNDNNIMPPKLEPEQFYVPYDILNTQIDPNMFKSTGDVTITHVPMPAPVAPIHKELFYQYVSSLGYNVAGSTTETEAAKRSQSSPNETPATDKLHHLDPLERRVMENDRPWIPKSIALPRVQNAANVRDHGYASQKFDREDPPPSRSRRIPPVVVMPALSYGSHGTEQRISSAAASYEDAVGYRDAQSLAEKSNSSRGTTQCAQHPSPAPIPMHENGPARQRNLRKLEQPTTALVKPRDTSPSSGWPPISGSESRQAKKLMSRLSDELLEQIEVGNNAMKERKADNPAELDYEPTDSGYASVPNLQRPLVNVNVSGKLTGQRFETTQIANCDDRSDAGTVLSAATSAIPELVHDSITQICEDIYNHLHFNTDTENHRSIIDSLPELIKAFAIRLGADSTQKMSSGIMHFVYKHHNKICAVLSRKLVEDDNHWSGISDTNKEAMSLADKISLWERGQQYDAIDQSDRFKGVVDLEDDELLSTAELSVYSKAILESRAYEWLLSTMRNKVVLEWGNSLNAINKTRQAVLLMLRPGTISSKKAPKPFTTTMILPGCWQSFVAKLWEAFLPDIQVVNVLNDTDCQLTNMEQYVNKVWPEFGSLVLYAFQRLLKDVPLASGTGTITVYLPENANIRLAIVGNDIRADIHGTAYLTAQMAELLAWMEAAFQQPCKSTYTPSVTARGNKEFLVKSSLETTAAFPVVIDWLIAGANNRYSPQPTLVHGYPIPRRPSGFTGLEIVPGYLPSGTKIQIHAITGRGFLQVGSSALFPVERRASIWFWHALRLNDTNSCCEHSLISEDTISLKDQQELGNISFCRHIITPCDKVCLKNPAGRISGDLKDHSLPHIIKNCPPDDTQWAAQVPTDLTTSSAIDCGSSSESFDSDLVSFSSFSGDATTGTISLDQELGDVANVVATRLLHDCDIRTIPTPKSRPGGSDSSNASAQISGSSTSTAQTQNITIPPRSSLKRKSYERENNDDDDLPEKRPRVGSKSAADTQSKSFACPYWKADPIMHRLCFQLKLLTSSRVKQHLGRVHSPRFYCQICYLTFRDTQTQDAHVTQRRCQREPGASLDGLLPEQHFQLSRKPKLTLSEKEKWFRIWEIVFPGRKRPHSPYIDRRLTDCCATFREHWQNRGLDILNQELRDSNIISIDGADEETRRQALQAVLTRGFDLIVESWTPPVTSQDITPLIESAMIELPTGTGPQIPPFPIFPSFAASTTPASSFVDSAVGLGGDVAPTITTRSHSSNAGFPPYADVFANENSIMNGVASMPSQNTQRITDAQLVSTSESSSINDPSHDFSFEMPDFNEEFWTTSDHRFHNDEA
ncbi:putative C2H2-type domain-containing protein [Seiridium cardinale]